MESFGHLSAGSILGIALLAGTGCAEAPASTLLSPEAQKGRKVFLRSSAPACGSCHTLGEARTRGTIGPNLDELKPDAERIRRAVLEGRPLMPAQEGILTLDQIDLLAHYLVEATALEPESPVQ